MDFSKCINTKHVLAKDSFKPGTAYRIKIHDERMVSKDIITGLDDYDDDHLTSYAEGIKALIRMFDDIGFDAVCVELTESKAVFISSYIGFKTKKLTHFKINITPDIIDDIINSEAAVVTPSVEILEMKPAVPDMLFRDTERPTKKPVDPKSGDCSWVARLFSKEDSKGGKMK